MSQEPITRLFKIGSTRIVEDESMAGLSIEAVRDRLVRLYPEVANAHYRERQEGDTLFVEFIPRPGRKG
jgi:hypothetical protein